MHRHGYQGRKFGRERDQRRALMKSLADALVLNASIETTLPKAKELVPYIEKLITKAKKGDLHNRRQIIQGLHTIEAAHKLVDDIAPKLTSRVSGHVHIEKLGFRRGDHAELAKVSFVDDLTAALVAKPDKKAAPPAKPAPTKRATTRPATKKPAGAKA